MDEQEPEETILELNHEYCDNCLSIFSAVCHSEKTGEAYEWSCVGHIPSPRRENNIHDLVNTIRLCIIKKNYEDETENITCHEWTPYEASCISMLLSIAVTEGLRESQPSPEEIRGLKEKGWEN